MWNVEFDRHTGRPFIRAREGGEAALAAAFVHALANWDGQRDLIFGVRVEGEEAIADTERAVRRLARRALMRGARVQRIEREGQDA